MEILIKPMPSKVQCFEYWHSKKPSVILVETEEVKEKLFNALVEQDDYWMSLNKKHLIKIAPKEIKDLRDLDDMCEYGGKTDIYDIDVLKEKFDFIIYQNLREPYCL